MRVYPGLHTTFSSLTPTASVTPRNSLSGADIMTFLYRERYAYNVFVNAARESAGLEAEPIPTGQSAASAGIQISVADLPCILDVTTWVLATTHHVLLVSACPFPLPLHMLLECCRHGQHCRCAAEQAVE